MPTLHALSLAAGWLLDRRFGDPERLPHPIVWVGQMIAFGERHLNKGSWRRTKGALLAVGLTAAIYAITYGLLCGVSLLGEMIDGWCSSLFSNVIGGGSVIGCGIGAVTFGGVLRFVVEAVIVFYCLAGTTLAREVRDVFLALDRSLDDGRRQVARIVGRDTAELSSEEVRKAALETLAENLSDGVVAPLFWLCLLGVPGMVMYKMVNTLDSMIAYRTERYARFGTWAARIDDIANFIPARLTALLIIAVAPSKRRLSFVLRYGNCHASPNSGWPEAALASVLDCQFGGGHIYHGEFIAKPFIGNHDRPLTTNDMRRSLQVCRTAEAVAIATAIIVILC